MYTVYKITAYPYGVPVSVHKTASEATADAEWYEEQGMGRFIVKKTGE